MRKSTCYYGVRFDVPALRALEKEFKRVLSQAKTKIAHMDLSVWRPEETWNYDTLEEFYAAAHQSLPKIQWYDDSFKYLLTLSSERHGDTMVDVKAPTRDEIDAVFAVLEENRERCRIPNWNPAKSLKVFIGHGNDEQWKKLKDHLHEKHGVQIEAYEIGARAGHAVRDILTYMLEDSTLALLVMTGEDQTVEGQIHPRLNVVHEAGLFQGRSEE